MVEVWLQALKQEHRAHGNEVNIKEVTGFKVLRDLLLNY